MNVLLVSHRFLEQAVGGTQALTNEIGRSIVDRGHQVAWLAVGNGLDSRDSLFRERQNGILEWEISSGFSEDYPLRWALQEEIQSRKIRSGVEELGWSFDAVHLLHFARVGLRFMDLPFFARSRVVVTLTDYTCICPDYQLYRRPTNAICAPNAPVSLCLGCIGQKAGASEIESWRSRNIQFINERAHAIFTQTPEQRRLLVASGLSADRVVSDHACYNIPREWRPAERRNGSNFRFGFVGRLSPEKGLHVVLSIFRQLHEWTGCELRVFGAEDSDGDYIGELRAIIAACPGVSLHAPVPLAALGSVFYSIDCLVIPSVWLENHPTVLTYAIALGAPVLCSRVASLEHLRGRPGINFAEANDPPDWLRRMVEIVEQAKGSPPELVNSISAARGEFEAFVTCLENVYQAAE